MPEFLNAVGIEKTYHLDGKDIPVLKGIHLMLGTGDLVSIMGVSGVGKSTFLQVLGTLDRPSAGTVFINEEDIFAWNDKKLAAFRNQTIGFVYQFHHLLAEFTALENVMMPRMIYGDGPSKAEVRAKRLLNEVGLSHRIHHRPGELSGGEQQRVAIARSLVMEPKIVLADEPTGNLDRQTAKDIEDLLLELNSSKKTILILATHNEELANRFPKQLKLRDGNFE